MRACVRAFVQAVANCAEVLAKRVPQLDKHPDGLALLVAFFQMNPDKRISAGDAVRTQCE